MHPLFVLVVVVLFESQAETINKHDHGRHGSGGAYRQHYAYAADTRKTAAVAYGVQLPRG
jgi:hypothetical protein